MTANDTRGVTCALCGTHSTQQDSGVEAAPAAYADLDTRGACHRQLPVVGYCPHCGYCAERIDKGDAADAEWVRSELYRVQLCHPDYLPLANRFLCVDLLAQARQQWDQACWACIHAAWYSDDQGGVGAARQCRLWALNRMGQARAAGLPITAQPGSEVLLRLDLLRRSQRFEQAARLIERSGAQIEDISLQRILAYQRTLVAQHNDRRHSLADLQRWEQTLTGRA